MMDKNTGLMLSEQALTYQRRRAIEVATAVANIFSAVAVHDGRFRQDIDNIQVDPMQLRRNKHADWEWAVRLQFSLEGDRSTTIHVRLKEFEADPRAYLIGLARTMPQMARDAFAWRHERKTAIDNIYRQLMAGGRGNV